MPQTPEEKASVLKPLEERLADKMSETLLACALWMQEQESGVDYHSDIATTDGSRVATLRLSLAAHTFHGDNFIAVVVQAMKFQEAWKKSAPKSNDPKLKKFLGDTRATLAYAGAKGEMASIPGPLFCAPSYSPNVHDEHWTITKEPDDQLTRKGKLLKDMNVRFRLDEFRSANASSRL